MVEGFEYFRGILNVSWVKVYFSEKLANVFTSRGSREITNRDKVIIERLNRTFSYKVS